MTRRALDAYLTTHAGVTRGLLDTSPCDFSGVVLEPCAGFGDMARPMKASGMFSRVLTNDIRWGGDYNLDATDPASWAQFGPVDWVITNPPFGVSLPIVRLALQHAWVGVAMYLRISWYEPTLKHRDPAKRRGLFLRDHPPTGFMPTTRISFTDNGKCDATTCAWFVWVHGRAAQWHHPILLED